MLVQINVLLEAEPKGRRSPDVISHFDGHCVMNLVTSHSYCQLFECTSNKLTVQETSIVSDTSQD